MIAEVGFLEARPAVQSLEQRLSNLVSGQIAMSFAPQLTRDAENLLPVVRRTLRALFALANAGVTLDNITLNSILSPIPLGIICGLFIGKQLGVFIFSFVAIKFKFAEMPANSNWLSFYAVGILTGIGFTMSLFVGNLAFIGMEKYLTDVKIGVLIGSLLSAVVGYLLLLLSSKKVTKYEKKK